MNPDQKSEKYDLIAISNHMGGLGSGHYTATALNNSRWVDFNDSMVSVTKNSMPEAFASREAYILYYRRRQNNLISNKTEVGVEQQLMTKSINGNLSPMKSLSSPESDTKLSPSNNSCNVSTPSKRRASEFLKMEVDDEK